MDWTVLSSPSRFLSSGECEWLRWWYSILCSLLLLLWSVDVSRAQDVSCSRLLLCPMLGLSWSDGMSMLVVVASEDVLVLLGTMLMLLDRLLCCGVELKAKVWLLLLLVVLLLWLLLCSWVCDDCVVIVDDGRWES